MDADSPSDVVGSASVVDEVVGAAVRVVGVNTVIVSVRGKQLKKLKDAEEMVYVELVA